MLGSAHYLREGAGKMRGELVTYQLLGRGVYKWLKKGVLYLLENKHPCLFSKRGLPGMLIFQWVLTFEHFPRQSDCKAYGCLFSMGAYFWIGAYFPVNTV